MTPPIGPILQSIFEFIQNIITGYHEGEIILPTSEFTNQRKQNLLIACQQLLQAIIGPGDLLDSDTRYQFVFDAYEAIEYCSCGKDNTNLCLRNPNQFVLYNKNTIQHTYSTSTSTSPFKDIAHAIVNMQDKLNESFYDYVIKMLEEVYPNDSGGNSSDDEQRNNSPTTTRNKDDYRAMAIELTVIAACCSAVHDFCFAAGITPRLKLPNKLVPNQPSRFNTYDDYATKPLTINRVTRGWGPYMGNANYLKPEAKLLIPNYDEETWHCACVGPNSKGTAAPGTCLDWQYFMNYTYGKMTQIPRFTRRLGDDRCLSRPQCEIVASIFSSTKKCHF